MRRPLDPLVVGDVLAAHDTPLQRAQQLDALSSILPQDRRERMAEILTDADIATLKHLATEGLGRNTLRAIASDLNYLETWSQASRGAPLPWPAPEALVLKFLAHHLFDAAERERDGEHGMPEDVAILMKADGSLRTDGPHAPSTVRRRLALWATLHRWRGLDGPFTAPGVRNAVRLACRAAKRPRTRKSARAVTRDILDQLLATCDGGSFADVRDRAMLLVAFSSGGRRRSEIVGLRITDLVDRDGLPSASDSKPGSSLLAMEIRLGRTKTAGADDDERVLMIGRPVVALQEWLALAGISSGPVFRTIDRFGRLGKTALSAQSVSLVIKRRCRAAGLSPEAFSAHGLRSGYLTEAARRGVPMQQAMRQSRHRSVQQAADYYNEVEVERGDAARLGQ